MPIRTSTARALEHGMQAATMAAAMPLAAAVTLSHRLPLLFGALAGSSSWSEPEFQRMLTEKVQAGWQISAALGKVLLASQRAALGYALDQAGANVAMATRPLTHPSQLSDFGSASFTRLAKLSARISDIGSKSAVGSLTPAHRRVTANARRLAGRAARAGAAGR